MSKYNFYGVLNGCCSFYVKKKIDKFMEFGLISGITDRRYANRR